MYNTNKIKQLAPRTLALLFALCFCGLAWGAPPHAQTQSQKASQPKASKTQHKAPQDNQAVKHFGKLTVHGKRLPAVCVLEWLKLAFKRSYTTDPAKANLPFCRLVALTGSHIKNRLLCETSAQVFHRQQLARSGGQFVSVAALDAALPIVDAGKLKATLEAVPSHYSRGCSLLSR